MCVLIELTEIYIHTDGNQYIYVDRAWTYRASISSIQNQDSKIYISYTGSSVINNINFRGPSSVIIPAGKLYVDFEIYIIHEESSHQKILKVSGSSNTMQSCGNTCIQILSHKSTPNYTKAKNCESIKCYSKNYTGSLGEWASCDKFPPPKYRN